LGTIQLYINFEAYKSALNDVSDNYRFTEVWPTKRAPYLYHVEFRSQVPPRGSQLLRKEWDEKWSYQLNP